MAGYVCVDSQYLAGIFQLPNFSPSTETNPIVPTAAVTKLGIKDIAPTNFLAKSTCN